MKRRERFNLRKEKLVPLEKVPETRPPHLDVPILTNEEEREALEKATELNVKRIEYEDSLKGKIPFAYKFKIGFWSGLVGIVTGAGAVATFLSGC